MAELYDKTNPKSIERYAKGMLYLTFQNIWDESRADAGKDLLLSEKTSATDYAKNHARKQYKGGLGTLVEECYFKYKSNNDAEPDFREAGVELKVTGYKKVGKKKVLKAKERLVITMINYDELVKEPSFLASHVWKKGKLILFVWYLYEKNKNKLDFPINFVGLFTPSPEDCEIIEKDYEKIVAKVRAGKAHELSESDTLYLGAATKAADASKLTKQPYSDKLAKPRAFSFKNSYMTYILNKYFVKDVRTYEPIVRGEVDDFESYVMSRLESYKDWTISQLCQKFGINENGKRPKNLESMIAFRILGVKGNYAEEFVKANIVVKTVRIQTNGKMKENMSFPAFRFRELAKQEWDTSDLANYFRETRFFFVVYQYDRMGNLVLKGGQFWNIPYEDLERDVRSMWERTKKVLNEGLKIEVDASGKRHANFPKKTENRVAHVRPHARNGLDVDVLPDGRTFPKQGFWLNNDYILSQLDEKLK